MLLALAVVVVVVVASVVVVPVFDFGGSSFRLKLAAFAEVAVPSAAGAVPVAVVVTHLAVVVAESNVARMTAVVPLMADQTECLGMVINAQFELLLLVVVKLVENSAFSQISV